jgi:hypothetical protein
MNQIAHKLYDVQVDVVFAGEPSRGLAPLNGRPVITFAPRVPVVPAGAARKLRLQLADKLKPHVGYNWSQKSPDAITKAVHDLLTCWAQFGLLYEPEQAGRLGTEPLLEADSI